MAKKRSVEIVIPIYNEAEELEENIKKLHQFLTKQAQSWQWCITIADNASTDDSLEIAKSLKKRLSHINVLHLQEKGRGRAVKRAWKESSADYLAYMDVDLSTDLRSFPRLLAGLESGAHIAIGSRLLPRSVVKGRTLKREILSRGYNLLIKIFFQAKFSDAQCGFKVVTKDIVRSVLPLIKDDAWFFDSELLILAERMGYDIYEEPVYWVDNPGSTVRVLGTVTGDLQGLMRLFISRPWRGKERSYE